MGGVGGANEEPFNNQGEDFKDRSFHNSTTNASSSNAAVHQNAQPSLASDRTEINENYSNGTKSSAFEKISAFIKGNLQHAADNLASCLVVDNVARQQCVSYLSEGFAGAGKLDVIKKAGVSTITKVTKLMGDYLGIDARVITNKAGDKVFTNLENTRRIRFDIKNTHGDNPHMHIETKIENRWQDHTRHHRIYFQGD